MDFVFLHFGRNNPQTVTPVGVQMMRMLGRAFKAAGPLGWLQIYYVACHLQNYYFIYYFLLETAG